VIGCGVDPAAVLADGYEIDPHQQVRESPIAWTVAKQKQQQPPSEGWEEAAAADRRAVEAGAPAAFMDFRCIFNYLVG
jgi:hypothetical protein